MRKERLVQLVIAALLGATLVTVVAFRTGHTEDTLEIVYETPSPTKPVEREEVSSYEEDYDVIVENPVETVQNPTVTPVPTYTERELEILAIVIYQEAGADYIQNSTRYYVGDVFMNRVESDRYPNTIEEVALQRAQYGTLYWTGIVWPERAQNPGESHAVQRAWDIAKDILEGNRTLPRYVIFQSEKKQGDATYLHQDGLYFCYLKEDVE